MDSKKIYSAAYISVMLTVFAIMAAVFNIMPRSKVSQLEKRELAKFPTFTADKLLSGSFTKDISSWYSDTEPYREQFMQLSMNIKDVISVALSEDNVRFHASNTPVQTEEDTYDEEAERNVGEYKNRQTADENAKIANAGILIVGKGDKARALMAFGGSSKGGGNYAEAANKYKEVFGPKVNVYCMVIPTAAEFYCPDAARSRTSPQRPVINNIHSKLAPGVHAVDIYTPLGQHASEDIYLRTDHHWAPLGAYYAAQKFAQVARVPFKTLKSYERHVVHRYVGSMYGYSKDIAIKNAPEDFVFYTPKGVSYTTTYIDYTVDRDYRVTSTSKPHKGNFFCHFKDGSGAAYCTFMGSDMRITQVRTGVKNHRRLMILKDSFGNAIPGYLFYSFEEIHVVDYRYFGRNMKRYVEENHITDILFANNIFNAYSPKIYKRYLGFLSQGDSAVGGAAPKVKDKPTAPAEKSDAHAAAPAATEKPAEKHAEKDGQPTDKKTDKKAEKKDEKTTEKAAEKETKKPKEAE